MSITPFVSRTELGILIATFSVTLFFFFAVAFVFYIFQAIGVYKIAKNRGYEYAWVAFIPIVSNFTLGAITDSINSYMGKKTHYRITLLISGLLVFISVLSMIPASLNLIINAYDAPEIEALSFVMILLLISLVCMAFSIIFAVFSYIATYKIFADLDNNNAVLFIVLSILLGITPFLLFAIRNKPSVTLLYHNQAAQPQYNPAMPPQ